MGIDPNDYRIAMARRGGVASAPKRAATTRKESAIQAAILDYLRLVPGVEAWKSGSGAFRKAYTNKAGETKEHFVKMGKRGVSDIVGWRTECGACYVARLHARCPSDPIGRALYIEVKKPGRYPDETQRVFLETAKAGGCLTIVARSVDDVRRGLGL